MNESNANFTTTGVKEQVIGSTATLVTVVATLLCVSGFLGNTIIAAIIVKRKKMQTSTNWFIFNLTISDLAIITTTIPFTLIHHLNSATFPFGRIGCKYVVMPVLEHFASVSVLTHTAISCAQYTVISQSMLRRFIRTSHVSMTIALIWLVSFLLLSATLMGFLGYFDLKVSVNTGKVICKLYWVSDYHRHAYRITVFILTYVLPMLLTGVSYYKIHAVVRDSLKRVNSLLTEAMLRSRSQKLHEMNTTLTVMYTTFALLTLPLQVFFCLREFGCLKSFPKEYLYIIFDVFLLLFYAQILTNPFVLLYVGDEYRKEFRHVCSLVVCQYFHTCNRRSKAASADLLGNRHPSLQKISIWMTYAASHHRMLIMKIPSRKSSISSTLLCNQAT